MRGLVVAAILFGLSSPAAGQTFSCRIGQDAACLDWGETVCSSSGQCVSDIAVCLESYHCDDWGFACKSDVEACVEAHDRLVRECNSLLSDHDRLRELSTELAEDFDDLQDKFDALEVRLFDAESCVRNARSLSDAHSCL